MPRRGRPKAKHARERIQEIADQAGLAVTIAPPADLDELPPVTSSRPDWPNILVPLRARAAATAAAFALMDYLMTACAPQALKHTRSGDLLGQGGQVKLLWGQYDAFLVVMERLEHQTPWAQIGQARGLSSDPLTAAELAERRYEHLVAQVQGNAPELRWSGFSVPGMPMVTLPTDMEGLERLAVRYTELHRQLASSLIDGAH